jgi:PhzF family phenazine biosynthesis protein
MSQRFCLINAFTDTPFRGNPAGVVVLDSQQPAPTELAMQCLAAEIGAPETAFLSRDRGGWRIRWFTPTVEVRLCGHATLSAAHVLWQAGLAKDDRLEFQSASGRLSAWRRDGEIVLDFPALRGQPRPIPAELQSAFGGEIVEASFVARDGGGEPIWVLELPHETAVRQLVPDLNSIRKEHDPGVVITARASETPDCDIVSRYFVPCAGIDEDPVTGVAHCCLAPYWAQKLAKNKLRGFQASRRGGYVGMRLEGDRVELSGRAVTIVQGELGIPLDFNR